MPSSHMDDILRLTDEELQEHLSNHGVTVGPIVASTRRVYQRKLAALLGSSIPESPYNEEVDLDESDGFITTSHSTNQNVSYSSTGLSSSPVTRKRYLPDETSSLCFDHDRHTPSPRPSLRTVTSSTSSTFTTRLTDQERSNLFGEKRHIIGSSRLAPPSKDSPASGGLDQSILRFLVKLLFIVLLIAAGWFTYQYYYSESPYSQLEHLARQALNSLEQSKSKQQTGGGGGASSKGH